MIRNINNIADIVFVMNKLNVNLIENAKVNVKEMSEYIMIFGDTSKSFMTIDYDKLDIPMYNSCLHLDKCMIIIDDKKFLTYLGLDNNNYEKTSFIIDDLYEENSVIEFEQNQPSVKFTKQNYLMIEKVTNNFKVYIEYYRALLENLFVYQLRKLLLSNGAEFKDEYNFILK